MTALAAASPLGLPPGGVGAWDPLVGVLLVIASYPGQHFGRWRLLGSGCTMCAGAEIPALGPAERFRRAWRDDPTAPWSLRRGRERFDKDSRCLFIEFHRARYFITDAPGRSVSLPDDPAQ